MNPLKEIDWHPDTAARRAFGRALAMGFPLLAAAWWGVGTLRGADPGWEGPAWAGGVGLGIGLLCLAFPRVALPFYRTWFFLGGCAGFVISHLILGFFFFGCLTPAGWLRRALGASPIRRGKRPPTSSHWKKTDAPSDPARYYRQY